MKRTIPNTYATCDHRTRFLGDEILHAEPVPKLLLMPMIWRGDLKPVLDAYLEQLRPLESGFTLGRVLHAEAVPATLDLGTAWLGSFRDRMLASRSGRGRWMPPVLAALEAVRRQMKASDPRAVADGLRALRRAADRIGCSRDEEEPHGAFSEGRRIADAARQRIADINARNRDFQATRSITPRLDSSGRIHWRTGDAAPDARTTAFRDAVHEARTAATPREQLAALNRSARAFWSGTGDLLTITLDALCRLPVPTNIGELNQRNRAFWAGRT